ncbi:hypothetical protein [Rubellimicrobium arenae]|uniref:hypothetical protein n=1 Tax=Rubellimicrobium arenae TaxID=2817372 RepID=UPI001B3086D8|nr:hypothetical protein [Rubellimicrobium arenae]
MDPRDCPDTIEHDITPDEDAEDRRAAHRILLVLALIALTATTTCVLIPKGEDNRAPVMTVTG